MMFYVTFNIIYNRSALMKGLCNEPTCSHEQNSASRGIRTRPCNPKSGVVITQPPSISANFHISDWDLNICAVRSILLEC